MSIDRIKRAVCISIACIAAAEAGACSESRQTPEFSRPEVTLTEVDKGRIRDQVLGGWVGQTIGLGSGLEYVRTTNNAENGIEVDGVTVGDNIAYVAFADKYWEPDGEICAGTYGSNSFGLYPRYDRRIGEGYCLSDDDMHIDILNQFIFRENGPNVGAEDIKDAWVYYGVSDLGGGVDAKRLMDMGYVAPYTGQSTYTNAAYYITESWIENETIGAIFPYMPRQAEAYADIFTTVQGDSYATYLGKLCAVMTSLAYEYGDMKEVLDIAFSRMGHSNGVYEMYEYVLSCYEAGTDWREACVGICERAVSVATSSQEDRLGYSINANAGMIFLALVYGENDFERSVKIASLAGLDGDCTAATVGGIVGTAVGFEGLPEKYREFLDGDSIYYNYTGSNGRDFIDYSPDGITWSGTFAYLGSNFPNALTYDQLTDITVGNIEAQIEARGGSVGAETYEIPVMSFEPVPSVEVENYSFESGSTEGWLLDAPENTSFRAGGSAAHLGSYGGMLTLPDLSAEASVYQELSLQEGHVYRADIWVLNFNDREFRLFAGSGKDGQFRSYINPISVGSYFMKAELIFRATSDSMPVGVYIPASSDGYSTLFSFDDFSVQDITYSESEDIVQTFECEDCAVSLDAAPVRDGSASGNKGIELAGGGGFRLEFEGNPYGYQNFRFFYENLSGISATCAVYIDDVQVCLLPLVPGSGFNASQYASLWLCPGEGTHTLKVVVTSYNEVRFDKVEIAVGSAAL